MSWEIKTLGEVVTKGSSSISVNKIKDIEGDYPIYGAKGLIKNVDFYHQDREYISIIKDGAGIGRVEIREPFSSVIGTLQYIIPKENIDTRFLYYFLLGIDFSKYSQGAAIPHIYFKDYKDEKIIVPPLDEQKRIVAQLDEAFEKIEKAKEDAQKNLENAKEIFQSELNALFENPEKHWEEKELDKLAKITSSKRIYKSEYVNEGVPFFRSKEIKELVNNKKITTQLFIPYKKYDELKTKFGVPKKDDILITAVGTIGEIYIVKDDDKFYFKDGNIVWLKNIKELNSNFLKFNLDNFVDKLKSLSHGAAYNALPIEKLNKHKISFPPSLEEQQEIVEKLNALQEKTKLLEKVYEKKLSNLDELRQSILQRAFRGGEEGE